MASASPQSEARVHLGDVVQRHQETSQDPVGDGLDRFLLVEHMDPERLKVTRWGDIGAEELPPTFYNVFRRGHVLYPSRNPHLRRTCRPNFDGICGEKTFVLQSNETFSQDLLSFMLQSERFVRYAMKMKVGSTNPHVRWRDIAAFEFLLPSHAEQARLVYLLSSLEGLIEAIRGVAVSLEEVSRSHLNAFFAPRMADAVPLPQVARIVSGKTPAMSRSEFWGGTLPWASGKDLITRTLEVTEDCLTDVGWERATVAPEGATLIVVRGMILAHTFPVTQCAQPTAFNQDVRALVPLESLDPNYLFLWAEWAGPWFLRRTGESSHGTKKLDGQVIQEAFIPVPSLDRQRSFVQSHSRVRAGLDAAAMYSAQLRDLKTAVLDHVFGEAT